ncbi:transglutaminase domain-containing protein [Microbacterium sp. GXF7504]
MSAPPVPPLRRTRAARTRARSRGDLVTLIGDVAFLDALLAIGVVAWWPVFRDPWLFVTGLAAIALVDVIALLGLRLRWPAWLVAAVTLGAYLVGGVPLAAPGALTDLPTLPAMFVAVLTAPATGWKNLLTLDLPLGTYQATLAPLFLLLLVTGVLALSLTIRRTRFWSLAAPITLLVLVAGVLFGSSAVTGTARIGVWEVPGVLEVAVGVGALGVALAWYLWRAVATRRAALRTAREATGVRSPARAHRSVLTRLVAGTAMAVVALVAGVTLAPAALAGSTRDVLRTGVDPVLRIRAELSPLTDYRAAFTDDAYDTVLFTVSGAGGADRVRLATLPHFDGRVMQAVDPDAADGAAFVRVPSRIDAGEGTQIEARVTVEGYRGIWVPTVGELRSLRFDGGARAALSDGFYYDAAQRTGVELADPGLTEGVDYTLTGVLTAADRDPATLEPGEDGVRMDPDLIPDSVDTWIEMQGSPTGGAGLAELIATLRARGYLSHALSVPADDPPAWISDLDGYAFEPSRAGHSTDRIDALFTELIDKQNDVASDGDALLVAAPGDDEQFAVAAAMIAERLGFAARVVVGARLATDDDTLPVCEDGACTGGSLAAWIEVQDADGGWTAVDTTPQHTVPLSPDVQQRRDPQNPTEVDPQQADTVLPPEADPADSGGTDDDPAAQTDLAWLWATARIGGISLSVLLILALPALALLLAKLIRYRTRRSSPDPIDRVVAGWDEFVDTALDHGADLPRAATRSEVAAALAAGSAATLAAEADRAVFAPAPPDHGDGEAFWALVDAERERMRQESTFWGRWKARLSLRSFRERLLPPAPRKGRRR